MIDKNMKDIDFALVEEKRPPMYTAMKYWGKKPHNIWNEYISVYTNEDGTVLDPFSGSAIAAFEAVKCGRKAIAFDINPLTSFLIEVYSTVFQEEVFEKKVNDIYEKIDSDSIYIRYNHTTCKLCGAKNGIIQHSKREKGIIYEVGVVCPNCGKRYLEKPTEDMLATAEASEKIDIPYAYPKDEFYNSPSFTKAFIDGIGGNSFNKIWTNKNLFTLSFIFNEIMNEENEDLKLQLLFGFIQSIHLCSKMCVPRRDKSNRAFSTSWGRSAYICSKRQMEMNPLLLFKNNCIGKQSVQSAMNSVLKHLGKVPKSKYVSKSNKKSQPKDYDILYGVVDINTIVDYIQEESIDFIITDPPYGGLVQYIDLSYLWLVWLKQYDEKYLPNIDAEITVKKDIQDVDTYQRKFTNGIKNLYRVLKPNGKIVFTFHNKDIMVWNAFLLSISEAGFKIEKVIHQQNRRTGESNVANPYGTSASDFYIRCVKSTYVEKIKTTKDEFENFVVDRAVKIISARLEPTPYQILFNGLLSEISRAGFELENFDENIHQFLKKHIGTTFTITKSDEVHGNLWWLINDSELPKDIAPLSSRVESTVRRLFKNKVSLSFDEVLAEIFINYPNGLTPDIKKIDVYIKKYAYKSGEKWIYNGK